MSDEVKRNQIKKCIQSFSSGSLTENSLNLFKTLGYNTERQGRLDKPNRTAFKESFIGTDSKFSEEKALFDDWEYIDLLFQLSEEEMKKQTSLFDAKKVVTSGDSKIAIESYLFFAVGLSKNQYSRTDLSRITREVNRLFPMPAMILFKTGDTLTLSVINRRLNKQDETKDVLKKVTLIKDIRIENPHRAHIEILFDLSFDELRKKPGFKNFVELHDTWQQTLDIKELNNRFFKELSNWYFWAKNKKVSFPDDIESDEEIRNATSLIRLITRVIFIWFIKEKSLVPETFFNKTELKTILKEFCIDKSSNSYYKAILQNLFFGTLNQKMDERYFARNNGYPQNVNEYGVKNLFRYADLFDLTEIEALALFKDIPFLNGGLFDCLDKPNDEGKLLYVDGFSRNPKKQVNVPDFLFFADEHQIDLNKDYGTKNKKYKVKGLIEILSSYKFTITENTPIEEEVALDPELLGRVFENLLASYNPETQTTARKQTGSFYTPREIVNYMADESLKAYLKQKLAENAGMKEEEAEIALNFLFEYNEKEHLFDKAQTEVLINAIDTCKILDPACGSGAFPMGILHKLVHILDKLDPNNEQWKDRQIEKAKHIDDIDIRDRLIKDIEEAFACNELDYGRKLYLIENCIFGVDIQPIAVQIAKLRFFISLVVDQRKQAGKDNFGIRALPNLETKFVAANTLIGINKPNQMNLQNNPTIKNLEKELKNLRHEYFSAKTRNEKLSCQKKDKELRKRISTLLIKDGWDDRIAKQLASWDPYDQNASATFFDPEWMFGVREGFDVVIGNPPYIRIQTLNQTDKTHVTWIKKHYASAAKGNYDLYVVFVERGMQLLKSQGQLAYILPHKFFNAQYGQPLRELVAGGRHLRHVVHFGDQQIFPGATNYVCLLFLARDGSDACRWVLADDLPAWLQTQHGPEDNIPAKSLTATEWNFVVGKGSSLFDRLKAMPVKLGDVADIFVGLQTSADDVFILRFVSETAKTITLVSRALEREWTFEKELIHPLVSGTDIRAYAPLPSRQFILFPYQVDNEAAELVPMDAIQTQWPRTAEYLRENKRRLEAREGGKFRGKDWYRFGRNQNLGIQQRVKLCVPRLIEVLGAAFDSEGTHFLDNVDVGGLTIEPTAVSHRPEFFLALLNTTLVRWFFPHISTPFRGGFRSANKQFLSQIPIRMLNLSDVAERAQHDALVGLVSRILYAKRYDPAADTSAPEQEIDQIVYKLYGLTEYEIRIVEEASSSK